MFLTLTQTLRAGCNLSVTNFGFLRKKGPMPLPEEIPAPETAVTNILAVQTSLISTLFPPAVTTLMAEPPVLGLAPLSASLSA